MRTFNTMPLPFKALLLSAALVVGGAAGALGVACVTGESLVPAAQAQQKQSIVVVNLKQGSNDLRAAVMAMELAVSLVEKGATVTIYANLEGVRLFDARQPDLRCGANDTTVAELYKRFVAGGGQVIVCPLCAEAAGIGADNLREGATLATMDRVAEVMLAADQVIDY